MSLQEAIPNCDGLPSRGEVPHPWYPIPESYSTSSVFEQHLNPGAYIRIGLIFP